MQKDLFGNEIKPKTDTPKLRTPEAIDADEDRYTKEYCFEQFKKEQWIWDLRCWKKTRWEHTKQDVIDWIDRNCEPNNCGHVQYLIARLLEKKWATKDEIAEAVLANKEVQYPNEIGTWESCGGGNDEVVVEEIEIEKVNT